MRTKEQIEAQIEKLDRAMMDIEPTTEGAIQLFANRHSKDVLKWVLRGGPRK